MTPARTQENVVETIDDAKRNGSGIFRYRLRNTNVLQTSQGIFFIDYLDPLDEIDPVISGDDLTPEAVEYIEKSLHSNAKRFQTELAVIGSIGNVSGAKMLDVGSGGGQFLALAKGLGADVTGIELDDARAFYAQSVKGVNVVKRSIDDEYWKSQYGQYDYVTLWDVIEHVNFPVETLSEAMRLLKPGGHLVIDTPCKDSFYHRFGQLTYFLSAGKFPTFLNVMYSSHPFGHKQIFSTSELYDIISDLGFQVIHLQKFHELSFPISFYILKMTRSNLLTKFLTPLAELFFKAAKIRNKMLVIAKAPDNRGISAGGTEANGDRHC